MNIELKLLDSRLGTDFPAPAYQTTGAAAFDLRAMLTTPLLLEKGTRTLVPTGFALHIADTRYAGFIYPRSGLGHKQGIVLGNGVGVIDSDYQGEIKVSLYNSSQADYTIDIGERIAQLAIMPVIQAQFVIVETFGETSERGEGGFGHTGTH